MKLAKVFGTRATLVLAMVLAIVGCGGGGGDGGVASPSTPEGLIGGTATKGPVAGASISAYAIESGVMGRTLGTAISDPQGGFLIPVGTYSGAVMLRMTGGRYIDEATGNDVAMQPGDIMTAMLASMSPASMANAIQVTPLTSMAQALAQRMAGGMTPANIDAANGAVGCYFQIGDILHVRPMNPLVPGAGTSAGPDARNYGMALAAMSQLAANFGMPFSSGMVTAMMDDVSDGRLNGSMGNAFITMHGGMAGNAPLPSFGGTSGMSNAMAQFARSPMNRSGVPVEDMQRLINGLMASTGEMPMGGACPGR